MKNVKLLLIIVLSISSMGLSIFPIKAVIKEGHFRFENFKRDQSEKLEYIHLMCFHQKPTTWTEPKQYLSGKHDLWVKASISNRDIPNSTKEAFVNFQVELESNKSYMLNRKVADDKISIWIQEVDTGLGVSDVVTTDLKRPKLIDDFLRKKQCKSGSV